MVWKKSKNVTAELICEEILALNICFLVGPCFFIVVFWFEVSSDFIEGKTIT